MATDQEIQELTATARELVDRIDHLVGGTGDQMVALSKTTQVNRRMIVILWVGFILDIALTIAMAVGGAALVSVTNRVDAQQQLTQRDVLCPLYQQFVNADTPKAREAAQKNGQDLEARDEAFRVIHRAYEVLDCK